jgi:uncharacterized membrane protein YphA (DoxX/SURF4 family)
MKIVVLIARILLGLMFLVFGLDKLYVFIPPGPPPTGAAGQFVNALTSSHYIMVVGVLESVGGLLLLFNRYVPVALTILAPIIVNILVVGILLMPMALPSGLVVTALWFLVFWSVRSAFAGVFEARVSA